MKTDLGLHPQVTGLPMPVGVLFPALLHAEVTTVFDTEPEPLRQGGGFCLDPVLHSLMKGD